MSSPHVFPHWEIQLYTTLQLHDYKYQIGWHSLSCVSAVVFHQQHQVVAPPPPPFIGNKVAGRFVRVSQRLMLMRIGLFQLRGSTSPPPSPASPLLRLMQ